MASQNFGIQNQVDLAGSPLSGAESPSSPGGDKIGRTQAKKLFKDEVEVLVQAVRLIPTYAESFAQLKRTAKLTVQFTDPTGQARQYEIGRSEFKEFVSQTVKRMQALTSLAFKLNKTRRRTAPNSGFLAASQFSQEIVNFFANATIGPIVSGKFVMKTDKTTNKKMIPESKSLRVQQGSRLNNVLYFTQQQINGQNNPLYGISSAGILTPLFALHAYYSQNPLPDPDTGRSRQGMQNARDATRLSASLEMRQALANVMRQTIQNDVDTLIEKYTNNPGMIQQIQLVGEHLVASINDPNYTIQRQNPRTGELENVPVDPRFPTGGRKPNGEEAYDEIFNPNNFIYAHFSKLISNGKVTGDNGLTEIRLNQIRQQIPTVYGQNVVGVTQAAFQSVAAAAQQSQVQGQSAVVPPYETVVLTSQQNFVALARAYKNQIQGSAQHARRTAEKLRQRAQQQAQVDAQVQAGLAGIGDYGLPGGNIVGNLPSAQPVVGLPGAGVAL